MILFTVKVGVQCELTPIREEKSAVLVVVRCLLSDEGIPLLPVDVKLNPWYIVGFVDGEGCFAITFSKHKTKRWKVDPQLIFEIELRGDDRPILEQIQTRFDCGRIYHLDYVRYGWMPHAKYAVKSYKDIIRKVIPFFRRYPLQGKKRKDFEKFCEAAEVFKQKGHLTEKGIERLHKIREGMNKRRPYEK